MKFNYKLFGKNNNQNILIVHGWGGSIKSLEKLGKILGKDYKVTLLELPGHGESDAMSEAWKTEHFVDFVKTFIRDQKLENIYYIGHSFGGHIGLRLCIEDYLPIKKLILINASGIKPRNSTKRRIWKAGSIFIKPVINILFFPIRNQMKKIMYKYIIRETDYVNTSGMIRETFKNVIKESVDNDVDKIKKPTLLIWADKDTYTPLWMGIMINEKIVGSKLEVLEGTHGLPLKQPEIVSEKILKWLNGK